MDIQNFERNYIRIYLKERLLRKIIIIRSTVWAQEFKAYYKIAIYLSSGTGLS
jgi:hypothetical protein